MAPRILIVKRDKIGDLLLTTPLIAHLREQLSGARIDVLCTDYNAWVIEGNRNIDAVFALPRVQRHGGNRARSGGCENLPGGGCDERDVMTATKHRGRLGENAYLLPTPAGRAFRVQNAQRILARVLIRSKCEN